MQTYMYNGSDQYSNKVYCNRRQYRLTNAINNRRTGTGVGRDDVSSCQSLMRRRRRRDRCRLDVIGHRQKSSDHQSGSGMHGTSATCHQSSVTTAAHLHSRHTPDCRLRSENKQLQQLYVRTSSTSTTCQSFNRHSVQHHNSTVSIQHSARSSFHSFFIAYNVSASLNLRHTTTHTNTGLRSQVSVCVYQPRVN